MARAPAAAALQEGAVLSRGSAIGSAIGSALSSALSSALLVDDDRHVLLPQHIGH